MLNRTVPHHDGPLPVGRGPHSWLLRPGVPYFRIFFYTFSSSGCRAYLNEVAQIREDLCPTTDFKNLKDKDKERCKVKLIIMSHGYFIFTGLSRQTTRRDKTVTFRVVLIHVSFRR